MPELGLGLTVPVDANRRILGLTIARNDPHESQPKPEVQKLYLWDDGDFPLAIGVSPEQPVVYLGDLVRWKRHPESSNDRFGLVVGFLPNEECCVIIIEQGRSGSRAISLSEIVFAATAWHRDNSELLDPKLAVAS